MNDRYVETKNVRINHPVKGLVHPSFFALALRLVKTLVWTELSYGAETRTLKMRDERKITSTEMCCSVLAGQFHENGPQNTKN